MLYSTYTEYKKYKRCYWLAQFSIQMLLSEAFEVWLQGIILLHAGIIETLRQRAQVHSDFHHPWLLHSSVKECLWVPEQVSSQRGFQRCSSLLSSSSSSSEQQFLQLSALCVSAELPAVCSNIQASSTPFNSCFYVLSFIKIRLGLCECV